MFKFLKPRCKHEYEEIGRYYQEIAYVNKTTICAVLVFRCKHCNQQYQKTAYCQDFCTSNQLQTAKNAVKELEKAGFVPLVNFEISQVPTLSN